MVVHHCIPFTLSQKILFFRKSYVSNIWCFLVRLGRSIGFLWRIPPPPVVGRRPKVFCQTLCAPKARRSLLYNLEQTDRVICQVPGLLYEFASLNDCRVLKTTEPHTTGTAGPKGHVLGGYLDFHEFLSNSNKTFPPVRLKTTKTGNKKYLKTKKLTNIVNISKATC